jgi:hypothetical protein
MRIIHILGLMLCLAGITLAGSRVKPPSKAPGAKQEAVKADGLVLKATGEFFEDRMPMRPVPKTPDDNAGRFRAVVKVTAANQGKRTVSNLSVSEIVVYYGGTTKAFCRIKPAPVSGTGRSASVAPGEQVTLEYSGAPEKIGALKDSMEVYSQVVVTYGKGKRAAVLTPEARVMITY